MENKIQSASKSKDIWDDDMDKFTDEFDDWEPYSETSGYLLLSFFGMKEENVIIIDGSNQLLFNLALKKIEESDIIGIDSEWKPGNFLTYVLQIATREIIYIFDIMKLVRQPDPIKELQTKQLQSVFENEKIKKVVFGFSEDLENLYRRYRNDYFSKMNCVYDLQVLHKNDRGQVYSLSKLSKKIFEKELDKDITIMNWAERPLRKAMIHYAAMDAFILIKIWDELIISQGKEYASSNLNIKVYSKICVD